LDRHFADLFDNRLEGDIAGSLDHLVGATEQRNRNRDPKAAFGRFPIAAHIDSRPLQQ
jgi:hypothetical protein